MLENLICTAKGWQNFKTDKRKQKCGEKAKIWHTFSS